MAQPAGGVLAASSQCSSSLSAAVQGRIVTITPPCSLHGAHSQVLVGSGPASTGARITVFRSCGYRAPQVGRGRGGVGPETTAAPAAPWTRGGEASGNRHPASADGAHRAGTPLDAAGASHAGSVGAATAPPTPRSAGSSAAPVACPPADHTALENGRPARPQEAQRLSCCAAPKFLSPLNVLRALCPAQATSKDCSINAQFKDKLTFEFTPQSGLANKSHQPV